jgi:acetoacetyl-CoA reductase
MSPTRAPPNRWCTPWKRRWVRSRSWSTTPASPATPPSTACSINGLKGQYGQANYAAAKAGMHGFTISLARENAGFGITVNTISPGYVATDMVMAVPDEVRAKIIADIPTGRLGKPEEIAYAVAFLVAEEAAWITGSNLDINGGHHMGW